MSKSLGNFYTIKDALKLHRPEVLRLFILSGHYRNPIVFSEDALDAARKGWERIYGAVRLTRESCAPRPKVTPGAPSCPRWSRRAPSSSRAWMTTSTRRARSPRCMT